MTRNGSDFERFRATQLAAGREPLALSLAVERAKRASNFDFERSRVRAGFTRGHLLEIALSLPGGSGSDRERGAAQELVWEIAGERRARDWIGAVEVLPAPRGGPLKVVASNSEPTFPLVLEELVPALDAAIAGLQDSLPKTPLWQNGSGDWTLFELEPEPADDFSRKDDLVMAITCVPELLKCYLEHAPFSSLRFSRHGELFFHLKYESRGAPEARLAFRERLEAALDGALVPGAAGRVVGGGLGLRYSYVDFVLSAIGRGLDLVCAAARAEDLPARSWVECFDDELGTRWIEVWPSSAAPPSQRRRRPGA